MILNRILCSYPDVIGWLQSHLLTCPFKRLTGIDCPGCGLQRSIIALLQGDLLKSIQLYPATIPLLFIALAGIFEKYLVFDKKRYIIRALYVFTCTVLAGSYIFKLSKYALA